MKSRTVLIIMILVMFITPVADAREHNPRYELNSSSKHDIVIDAVSWMSFSITCSKDDTLSGEFKIVNNGELFPGDQTEYDNWPLHGIDFFVFSEENYILWVEGSPASSLLEGSNLNQLTWSVEIPNNDEWYIVYSNDSIYMAQIEGSIIRTGQSDQIRLLIAFIVLATLLSLTLFIWKKK